jgi:DNA polymerase III epsilon subunit-like protein
VNEQDYFKASKWQLTDDDIKHNAQKYVVLDVETSGLKCHEDDLLSLSVFDPFTGLSFNHYFPLYRKGGLTPEAAEVNGLSEDFLLKHGATHWKQDDVDELVERFGLDKRTILIYTNFDERFVKDYLNTHKLKTKEPLHFFNFKTLACNGGKQGCLKKDFLCFMFGIKGVTDTHTSINDCYLEWELFKKLDGKLLLFVNEAFYFWHDGYMIPASKAKYFANTGKLGFLKEKELKLTPVFSQSVSSLTPFKSLLIDTSVIDGSHLEEALREVLNCKPQQGNLEFVRQNHFKLEWVYDWFDNAEIKLREGVDGSLKLDMPVDQAYEREINRWNKQQNAKLEKTKMAIKPFADYLKHTIFKDEPIIYQELVKRPELNSYGFCDFSSSSAMVEMKSTFDDHTGREFSDQYFAQMYVTSNGRTSYLLVFEKKKLILYLVEFVPYGTVYKRRIKGGVRKHCPRKPPTEKQKAARRLRDKRRRKEVRLAKERKRRGILKRKRTLARKKREALRKQRSTASNEIRD